MGVPPPPDGDPTADMKSTADRKPLEVLLSYPGRIWIAVAAATSPDPNLLSKIRYPNVSSLSGLSILLTSELGRHGLPLPLHSTSVHSIRSRATRIQWRKVDKIGEGAFAEVYRAMNLDSGHLLAVKQVKIETRHTSKEDAQDHIRELEKEVNLLKILKHPNIVGYLGTDREEDKLNIFLEFVSGGSISYLLSKMGPFTEAMIRSYTKQVLQGLDYLHHNKIIHRDIKGANILLADKGCIKLADFGASIQVLAPLTAADSRIGTAYYMAPEVIGRIGPDVIGKTGTEKAGYSFPADIWSVGCTVIEMATGEQPWISLFKEPARAIFHVGKTQSHPPIPKHLSSEANDFLLECFRVEPGLRPTASDLLQHPFVRDVQAAR